MRSVITSLVLGAALIASGTVAIAEEKETEKFAAKVNGVGIPQADFDRSWRFFMQRSGIPTDHAEKSGKVNKFRQQVLDTLIDKELLIQSTKGKKMPGTDEVVAGKLAEARKQFPKEEDFQKVLGQNHFTLESLKTFYAREYTIQAYVEQEIGKGVTVSDAEVHDFYLANKQKFENPEQVRARHILVKVDEKADAKTKEAAKAKAEDLAKQAKSGTDFGELAKKNSDCPSAPKGGDLGFFQRGQMVEPFDKAAFAMKPGEISGVVETQFGYHVIKCEELKAAGMVPEAEASAKIKDYLKGKKIEDAVEVSLKALREKAKIEILAKP